MGDKVFNADEYLVSNGVKVVIKGKSYTVNDIPFNAPERLKDAGEEAQKKLLSEVIGCPIADLEDYGMATTGKIMRFLTENLFQESSQKDQ